MGPMLVAWVPSWVREQHERRNPYFRACLRQALDSCKDECVKPRCKGDGKPFAEEEEAEEKTPNPYYLPEGKRTNRNLLRLVRRRMIARFLRKKAEKT